MSRPDLAGILDTCLQRIQMGSSIEEALADYPEQAPELRRLLQISLSARPQAGELRPPASAQADSRRRFLSQAGQLKERRGEAALWGVLSLARRSLGSAAFVAAALLLLFVALKSSRSLPGDGLYPVKLAAEQVQVDLAANPAFRAQQETIFEARRAEEVKQMIEMRRSGAVSFSGFLSSAGPQTGWQVAGIPLKLSAEQEQQFQALSEVNVEVKGRLGNDGQVKVETLRPLLDSLHGTLTGLSADHWVVSGQTVWINQNTRINGVPHLGSQVQAQVARLADGDQLLAFSASLSGGTQTPPTRTATSASADTAEPTLQPEQETPVAPQAAPTAGQEKFAPKATQPPGGEQESGSQNGSKHQSTAAPGENNQPGGDNAGSHPGND